MNHKGFTLLELATTLVITALIIGAITSGAHLWQAARINSIISEISGYKEAVDNFYLKYYALPGDMPNASDFFGSCGGSNNICNGDDDTKIEYVDDNDESDESFSAWQHLASADMISNGHLSGNSSNNGEAVIDTNVPIAKIDNGGYAISYATANFTDENVLILGANKSSSNLLGGVISAADAYTIDKKIDDKLPLTGNVRAAEGDGLTNCINETPTPDVYKATNEDTECILGVNLGD